MGKIRRARQKLHQSRVKSKNDNLIQDEAIEITDGTKELIGKSPMLKSPDEFAAIPDNLFAGIDINFDSLKKQLIEDDRLSVKSIAKSCKFDSKGKLLTKKEKQKIKHDLWMSKINSVQQLKKEALQKRKKRKSVTGSKKQFDLDTQIESVPLSAKMNVVELDSTKSKVEAINKMEKNTKHKPLKKAKARQKEMLQEISAFRKLLSDPKIKKNPSTIITECVENKILKEVKMR